MAAFQKQGRRLERMGLPDYTMNKGVAITALILFAIAIGIYVGFIYMVGNVQA